jgi:hypothetical protein
MRGSSRAWIRLRWQTAAGNWTRVRRDVMASPGPAGAGGWAEIFVVSTVPDGAEKLVVLLNAGSQKSANDIAWFDDVEVYRLLAADAFAQPPVRWDLKTNP